MSQHRARVLTPGESKEVIDRASSVAVGDCECRRTFQNCDHPVRADLVVGHGFDVTMRVRGEEYEEISRERAKRIIEECSGRGLVQSILWCRDEYYAICNCCQCCCAPLRIAREYGVEEVRTRDKSLIDYP